MKATKPMVAGFLVMLVVLVNPSYADTDPQLAVPTVAPLTDIKPSHEPDLQQNDVSRFTNTIALINQFYVKPVDERKLLENAIRGIVAGLDPHSEYLDEAAYKALLVETSGEFAGIGIEVTSEFDVLKVISPIDDTPAAKAGMQSGDYIVSINNKLVSNMTLDEAIDQIHGKKDTQIILTVLRKGQTKPLSFTLKRDIIHSQTVKAKMLDNGFGYVRISQFQQPTAELMLNAIKNLQTSANGKLKGLILDLRNNPGGLLKSGVQVVNAFLESKNLQTFNKTIVYTKGHSPAIACDAKANSTDILQGRPLIVLVNQGSASASEIVAGALQDYKRATIVGINSFGKGSVQTIIPLDKTHALKLTTALYYTPAGRQIQNEGIKPDVIVENLKIESPNLDTSLSGPIREFELKNHLLSKTTELKKMTPADFTDLAQQDFQLYEALKMLQVIYQLDSKVLVQN
jgi:carboxyl-terminal processing protease